MNKFYKYFKNIRQNLNAKLMETAHYPNNAANFFCTPTCPTEIINTVHSNNSKKSGGYDNIDPNIIQHVTTNYKPINLHLKQFIYYVYCSQKGKDS